MLSVGLFEAKQKLSALVERARHGEIIMITNRGKEVARLVGARASRAEAQEAVRRIRALRKSLSLGGLSIRDLINEGRP